MLHPARLVPFVLLTAATLATWAAPPRSGAVPRLVVDDRAAAPVAEAPTRSATRTADPWSAAATQVTPQELPGLRDAALILRDDLGIPHVVARNEHDAWLLQGFVQARDRLFQMDLTRRQASGTLAELFGPPVLAGDVEARVLGLRRAAERSWRALEPRTREAVEAYAAGVNAFVELAPTLPPEYGALEITRFEPWTALDSVAVGKAVAFSLSFDLDIGPTERLQSYVAAGAANGFDGAALYTEDLFRKAPFVAFATVEPPAPAARATDARNNATPALESLSPVAVALGRQYLDRVRDLPLFAGALDPTDRGAGSNEWAVAGRHTTSGRPLIANDPHLGLPIPATFHQVHVTVPRTGLDVMGSSFAGAPFVIQGQNRRITWGSTVNPMDVTDVFQETVVPDPSAPSGLAIVNEGEQHPIVPIPARFRYNLPGDGVPDNLQLAPPGGQVGGVTVPAAVLVVPFRGHGPILALDAPSGVALSLQYTGFAPTRELDCFRHWAHARNLREFVAGLQLFDFGSENWVYADVDGNIAYFTSAELPLREDLEQRTVVGLPPWFIRTGTGGADWLRAAAPDPTRAIDAAILPFAEMPQVVNPDEGWFVNANNDPLGVTFDNDPLDQLRPGGGLYYLNDRYDMGLRATRIAELLRERLAAGPLTAKDMEAIQADVQLSDSHAFVPFLRAAWEAAAAPGAHPALAALAADERLAEAMRRLAAWGGQAPTGVRAGWDAADVDGERLPPTRAEIESSIAATIYSTWRGRFVVNVIDATIAPYGLIPPGNQQAVTALRHLLDGWDERRGVGASGLDFFVVEGVDDPAVERDIVLLRSLADALDLLASDAFAAAFGGSTNQEDYRWGRLHRVVFRHPLDGPFSVPPAGGAWPPPLEGLPGIPADGGYETVDASRHSVRAAGSNGFMFTNGPNRRYVGEARRRWIDGRSALPGGESGVLGSPWYANLLPLWLTNDAYPLRQLPLDVLDVVTEIDVLVPAGGPPPPIAVQPVRPLPRR